MRNGEYLRFRPETREGTPVQTHLAVVRPPGHVSYEDIRPFTRELSKAGLLPLVLSKTGYRKTKDEIKWFPTDALREVDGHLFVTDKDSLNDVIQKMRSVVPQHSAYQEIADRTVEGGVFGGNYVYLDSHKLHCTKNCMRNG